MGNRELNWYKAGSLIKSELVAEELGLRSFRWPKMSLVGRLTSGVQKVMQIFLNPHHALVCERSDII